jgi:hypothetical protein
MESKYQYLIIGIIIGWVTKFPLILKWYRELKQTRSYEKMQDKIHVKEITEKYYKMFPDKKPLDYIEDNK